MAYTDLRRGILLATALYLAFRFIGTVAVTLFLFYTVFLLAMAINPIVTRLARRRVPRFAGALLIALCLLGILMLFGWLIIPPIVDEASDFARDVPTYWEAGQAQAQKFINRFPPLRDRLARPLPAGQELIGQMSLILTRIGRYTVNIASALFAALFVLIMTIYTVAYPQPLLLGLLGALPTTQREQASTALVRISRQVRAWIIASLLLGAVVGLADGIGLALLGVPNALLLAVLAGLGEFIPNFGPVIAAIPAVFLAFAVSPQTALWVLLLYLVIQQIENHFLVPFILGSQMELHPLSIAFFILVMGGTMGVIGTILAVPTAAIVKVLYEEFYYKPRHPDHDAIVRDVERIVNT
ncbi:MAG TPA: AI-2E family transporter [Armatimonadota bacterium]|nr:AI-2E family transporter [Armatimonadota bacterium]